jgi:ATP-dependent RNA helicase DDX1
MFSATLHDPQIKELSEVICKFPIWVDLKGKDTVPEVIQKNLNLFSVQKQFRENDVANSLQQQTVHHAVVFADPFNDQSWKNPDKKFMTDRIHARGLSSSRNKLNNINTTKNCVQWICFFYFLID